MSPRLVIVHERFTEIGGSEAVVNELATLRPDTRIFAPIVDDALLTGELANARISSSGLQRLYRSPGGYAHLLPLLPMAMARADLSDAEVVVMSHHAFANRVRVPEGVPTVSYTHSPARWIWDPDKLRGEGGGRLGTAALRGFAAGSRRADRAAAARVDHLVANSQTVAGRILRWWGRHAIVVNPPVDVDFFHPAPVPREDFLLVAGRLVPYKRAHVAVAAATALGRRLVVAGQGRARPMLERIAGPTVEFVGSVSRPELRDLYRRCAALVFAGEEDFGIVPVEAQACGAPVIAARVGGATETVVDGLTGMLVDIRGRDQVEAFTRAIADFDRQVTYPMACRANAEYFSTERFRHRMSEILTAAVDGRTPGPGASLASTAR